MIYPFDAGHALEVLRVHYEYANAITDRGKALAAKASGLVAHDRLLNRWDVDFHYQKIRRHLSKKEDDVRNITIR
jgi:hypothetical protein